MNRILQEDFEQIYKKELPWDELNGKTVLVTGATGLLGTLLLKYMDFLNKKKNLSIRLLAVVRDRVKAEELLAGIHVKLFVQDITSTFDISEEIHYVFHCAAVTKSGMMVEKPVEVFSSIVSGTENVLRMAKKSAAKRVIYLSSMEVYGKITDESKIVTEDVIGIVNPLSVRSCYPIGKQAAENLCYSYYREYQLPVCIARLAQTFGAGILPGENRVFAQFAKSAKEGKDIVLHTDGSSYGNYCYTADAVSGLFAILFSGQEGEAYNIVNENATMTIREMAELVAREVADGQVKVVLDIPKDNLYGYAAPTKLHLSSQKIHALGWQPTYGMTKMYQRMMQEQD